MLTRGPGCHDDGYIHLLETLITQGLENKLVLLSGCAEVATGFQRLGLPFMSVPGLFERQMPARPSKSTSIIRSETDE
jgi:hypothetical protein